ncbi:serine/threonine-protein kinase, partial [Thermoleptolyngbya sp. M55_K2018_002]|uniref:serine/threonine-protein kinase n=1 Tax=Thermoleptolyngbya sp. M55_K2018_002 TaxID=2747808 RepID=UPI0019E3A045
MLGTVLGGRYRIITILGAGGFGQTYLAEDEQQPRRCVVKQFKPVSQDLHLLVVARRLFDTEVETLRRLGQHDQIPELYDSFQEGEEFYLVQEFIEGHALSEEFAGGRQFSEPEAIALLHDVLNVLSFVHQNQVIHRDIKPANLIRRKSDGKLVLIDFGAVKEIQTRLTGISGQTEVTVGIGTQGYTPSEQLMGRPRYCSDLYALGMTVVQAVTGCLPSQLPEDPETLDVLWQHQAELSPGLMLILDYLVRYDFSQRYQSVAEVQHALTQLANLPTDLIDTPTSLLPPAVAHRTQPLPPLSWRDRLRMGWRGLAIATATAAA